MARNALAHPGDVCLSSYPRMQKALALSMCQSFLAPEYFPIKKPLPAGRGSKAFLKPLGDYTEWLKPPNRQWLLADKDQKHDDNDANQEAIHHPVHFSLFRILCSKFRNKVYRCSPAVSSSASGISDLFGDVRSYSLRRFTSANRDLPGGGIGFADSLDSLSR